MKQKVLYLITKSEVGGAQKYVSDLIKTIDQNRLETEVLYGGKDLTWLSNATYPWLLFFNDWLAIIEMVRLFKKKRPDIIHLNSSKTGVLGSLAAKLYNVTCHMSHVDSAKIVFTAHGWVFNPTNAISLPAKWFYILLHKIAAKFQDKIICVSEYDYNLALYQGIAPKEKLITIHNGINLNIKFLDKQTAKKELRERLAVSVQRLENKNTLNPKRYTLNPDLPWIGSVGRLVKEKNYETLISAAALVPNVYFFIIGEGPELKMLKVKCQMSNVSDRFFFIDPTGEDARYLKAFDIFAMSSIKEGLPYILLEAMAANLPIVVTEAGGMPEIIKNHNNGIMVAQKNPDLLAKSIGGLIANPGIAKELSKTAAAMVKEKFNVAAMAKATEMLYQSLD